MRRWIPIIALLVLGTFGWNTSIALAALTDTVSVTAKVGAGTSSVSVTETTIGFGTVAPSESDHRFTAGPMTIEYFAAGAPWAVRVYTNNSPDPTTPEPEKAGLKGADGTTYEPLKVWCANYGPTASMPDEENDYFWGGYDFNGDGDKEDYLTSGSYSESDLGFDINGDGDALDTITPTTSDPLSEEPVWLRIPEKDEHDAADVFTWRRLTWKGAELPSPFGSRLGFDAQGVKPQDYSTTLTVEILNY